MKTGDNLVFVASHWRTGDCTVLNFPKGAEPRVDNGNRTVRFSDFEVDFRLGEIRKSGNRIKLQDQPFKVLQILLEQPGELVTREELQSCIWPDEGFGDFDHAVNIAVGKLRAALGDSSENPSFIQTVPRRGYRFIAKLDEALDGRAAPNGDSLSAPPSRVLAIHDHSGEVPEHKRADWTAVATVVVAGIIAAMLLFLSRRSQYQPADFHRLTVNRGTVYSARFAPGSNNVLYAASWDGKPVEIFSADTKLPGARNIGLPATQLLALSSSGEMAVLRSVQHPFLMTFRGTLGQVPLTGGSPRQLAENVEWADWSPDGASLAVVHDLGGQQGLEFPIGHVLYQTSGWISHVRVSPTGDQIAFLDHPVYPDDRGTVSMVDVAGHKKVLSTGWESVEGLAWSGDRNEIWFSAAKAGAERAIYAVDLSGRQRPIFRAPGGVTLQDISADGRVLLTRDDQRVGMMALPHGTNAETRERELSWLDWSAARDISKDGETVLFDEQGAGAGPNHTVAVRDMSGSPPTPLGEGMAGKFSADGKWAASVIAYSRLLLLPTGAGTAKELEKGDIQQYGQGVDWMPDNKQVIFPANLRGHAVQCFTQSADGGEPRAVTPEGVTSCQPSPDGKVIAGFQAGGSGWLYPVDRAQPRSIPGLLPGEYFDWTSDPRFLYVYQGKQVPVRVYRLDVFTGQKRLFREIAPPDVAGLNEISRLHFSSDGQAYVYSYTRWLSELYLVTGLK
jgi:DNA-binding winged helix-turn-helix (wHTH) protein/Tol biopolymer transport system component